MDRYISSLHKNTLAYNICIHLDKCKTDEERKEIVYKILNNFEETREEYLPENNSIINDRIIELQKQVDELKFDKELLQKLIDKRAKDTAKEICLEIVKDMPKTIKEQWIKWFHELYGVEVE